MQQGLTVFRAHLLDSPRRVGARGTSTMLAEREVRDMHMYVQSIRVACVCACAYMVQLCPCCACLWRWGGARWFGVVVSHSEAGRAS